MTFEEIVEMLEDTEIPSVYYAWPESEAPALPYICFYYPSMSPETADNTHHAVIYQLNIELYTSNKDFTAESTVEDVLLAADMVFTKEEQYLDKEHMYEVLYMMEVIIDG